MSYFITGGNDIESSDSEDDDHEKLKRLELVKSGSNATSTNRGSPRLKEKEIKSRKETVKMSSIQEHEGEEDEEVKETGDEERIQDEDEEEETDDGVNAGVGSSGTSSST